MAKANLKLIQNESAYTIEKGIPLPPSANGPGRVGKYPFAQMRVGDSFVCDKPQTNLGATLAYSAKKLGIKFATRKIDAGTTRIWRTK
jgi:hypothetical protein